MTHSGFVVDAHDHRFDYWLRFLRAFGCAYTGARPDVGARHAEHPGGLHDWDWPASAVAPGDERICLVGAREAEMVRRERARRGNA